MKRGQSALEYLVTYGWAILALVIIAGVFWYTGVFDPSRFSSGKECTGFSPMVCQDFRVSAAGALTLVINNGAGSKITGLTLSGGTCTPTTVTPSQNSTCTWSGLASIGSVGDSYDRLTVSGWYTDSKSSLNHTFSGTVKGKYE